MFTSYFGNKKQWLKHSNIVAISVSTPHYYNGKTYPKLYPTMKLIQGLKLGHITEEKYNQLVEYGCKFNKTYSQLQYMYDSNRIKFNLPQGVTDVWDIDFYKDDKWGHSTQKPMQLCNRIVEASSDSGDLIYIPFAGSGSEIISCINNNRNYIATETRLDYINNIIAPRILKECNQDIVVNF